MPVDRFASLGILTLDPEELTFEGVRLQQQYRKVILVTNNLNAAVEASVRAGSPDRYSVSPTTIRLRPGESCEIEVRLKIIRFALRTKATQQGIRDAFHIKSMYFDQKFHSTFFLATDDDAAPQPDYLAEEAALQGLREAAAAQPPPTGARSASAGPRPRRSTDSPGRGQYNNAEPGPRVGVRIPAPSARTARSVTPPHARAGGAGGAGPSAAAIPTAPPDYEAVYDGDAALRGAQDRRIGQLESENGRLASELGLARQEAADRAAIAERLQSRVDALRTLAVMAGREADVVALDKDRKGGPGPLAKQLEGERTARAALSSRVNELEGQLSSLRARTRELESECVSLRDENGVLRRLQDELGRSSPSAQNLVEVAVQQERARHEDRSRRVLEMLRSKDEELERLEAAAAQSEGGMREAKLQLVETLQRLDESERRVQELLETKVDLQRRVESSVQEASREKASLRAEVQAMRAVHEEAGKKAAQALSSGDRAEALRHELLSLRAELSVKTQAVSDKDAEIQELRRRLRGQGLRFADSEAGRAGALTSASREVTRSTADADRECHELRARVAELEAMVTARGRNPALVEGPEGAADLRAKVLALEAANRRLEQSLLDAARAQWVAGGPAGPTAPHDPHGLRELLAQKDANVAGLLAEVAALRATLSAPGAPRLSLEDWQRQRAALEATVSSLRVQLMDRESLLDAADARAAALEAQIKAASASAAGGAHPAGGRRGAVSRAGDAERSLEEASAQAARSAAIRLNARVSEIALSEQQARSEAAALRSELEAVKRQLLTAAAVGSGRMDDSAPLPGVPGSEHPLQRHLEDAEVAVADMHGRLLDALAVRRQLEAEVQEVRGTLEFERARTEAKVRAARDDGSARIQGLEEAVRVLGGRSDLHREAARLHGEATTLRRTEARLKADLEARDHELSSLKRQLASAQAEARLLQSERDESEALEVAARRIEAEAREEGGSVGATGEEVRIVRQLQKDRQRERIRLNQQVAKATQRAAELERELEASRKEAATAKAQLDSLRERRKAMGMDQQNEGPPGAGGGARGASPHGSPGKRGAFAPRGGAVATMAELDRLVSAEARITELQGRVALQLTEIGGLREDSEARELEVEGLRARNEELEREAAAAAARVGELERAAHDAREAAAKREVSASATHSSELATASRRATEADRQADRAVQVRQEAEDKLRAKEVELQRSRLEVEAARRDAEVQCRRLQEQVQSTLSTALSARKEAERALSEADERKAQLTVLMETVETLQAGNTSEKDQRIVALTSQLATSRAAEVALDRRCTDLATELESRAAKLVTLDGEAADLRSQIRERDARLAAQQGTVGMLEQEVAALRLEGKAKSDEARTLSRELDAARDASRKADSEAQGLRASLEASRRRHHDQLARERADYSQQLRDLKEENLRLVTTGTGEDSFSPAISAEIQQLIEVVRARGAQEDGGDPSAALEDLSWRTRVLDRFRTVVVASEQAKQRAEAASRAAQQESAFYLTRLKETEVALDRALSNWEVVEASRAAEAGGYIRSLDLRSLHSEEKADLKDRQIAALSDALDKTGRRLIAAEAALRVAREALDAERGRSELSSRRARLMEADAKEAEARVSALVMEQGGTQEVPMAEALAGGALAVPEAVARRDLGVKQYFESEVTKLLLASDPREKVLGITRELCGIKVVESQLLASLAAARRRADALGAQAATLRELNAQLEGKLHAIREGAKPQDPAESASSLAAQLSARTTEVFRLQDEVLTLQQRLQSKELRAEELERDRSRLEEAAARARMEAEGGLNRLREELTRAQNVQLSVVTRELDQSRQKHTESVRGLRSELRVAAERAAEDKRAAVADAIAGRPDPKVHEALRSELEAAVSRAAEHEEASRRASEENAALLSSLKALERELMELRDERETRGRALEELERILTSIERSADRAASSGAGRAAVFGAGGARRSGSVGPSARGAAGGAAQGASGGDGAPVGPGALAELSRQLVQAKLGEADADRKLRVQARAELELRSQLRKREERIEELRRQLVAAEATARRGGRGIPPPRPGTVGHSRSASGGEDGGDDGPGDAPEPRPAQPREIAALKSELARREAQIEHLEVSLAQAIAGQRDREADLERLQRAELATQEKAGAAERHRRELARMTEAVNNAVVAAHSVLSLSGISTPALADAARGSPVGGGRGGDASGPTPLSVLPAVLDEVACSSAIERMNAAVTSLVQAVKDKDISLKKGVARIKALESSALNKQAEAFGAPLEASQRAVIRDLTQRCNQLAHEKAELRAECDVVRKQLSTLRNSLGGVRALGVPAAGAGPGYEDLLFGGGAGRGYAAGAGGRGASEGPSRPSATATPSARNGPEALGEAKGLLELLTHHMMALRGAQGRIADVASNLAEVRLTGGTGALTNSGPGAGVGRLFVDEASRALLLESSGQITAELESMEAALRVLGADLTMLDGKVRTPGEAGQTSGAPSPHSTRGGRLFSEPSEANSGPDGVAAAAAQLRAAAASAELTAAEAADALDAAARDHDELTAALSDCTARVRELEERLEEAERAHGEEANSLRQQGERWRSRCDELHGQLEESSKAASQSEASLRERLVAVEREAGEELRRLKLESSKLEAQLAGAEAARKELLSHAAQTFAATVTAQQQQQYDQQQQGQGGGGPASLLSTGDLLADLTSKLAAAEGRTATLEKQGETQRAAAQAQVSVLQEECEALRDSLEKERQERARLVSSLRETVAGLRQVGGEEERLRLELVRAQDALAAAQERGSQAETRALEKRRQAKAARQQYRSLQEELQRKVLDAEQRSTWVDEEVSRMRRAYLDIEARLGDLDRRRGRLESDLVARIEATLEAALRSLDTSPPEALLRELESLERMSTNLEARCRQLEAEVEEERSRRAAVDSELQEERARVDKYRDALREAKREARRREEEQVERAKGLESDVLATRGQVESLRAEAEELRRGLVRVSEEAEGERRALVERHRATIQDLERRMDAEREVLMRQGEVASSSAEKRSRQVAESTVSEVQARAEAAIKVYRLQLESLAADFRNYQQVKGREISQLEAQLEEAIGAGSGAMTVRRARPVSSAPSDPTRPSAPAEAPVALPLVSDSFPGVPLDPAYTSVATNIRQAMEVEGLAAARREITLERLMRTKAESELGQLRSQVEELKAKAKDATKEAKQLRSDAAAQRDKAEDLSRLESEANELREQLRAAKRDAARRGKDIESLRARLEEITPLGPVVPSAQLEAERDLRDASEAKARAFRAESERKDALVSQLKKKLDEYKGVEAREAELQERATAAEARVRQLQTDLQRRSLTVDQLRSRLDEVSKDKEDREAKDDADKSAVKRVKGELTRKEAALSTCQRELTTVKEELAKAQQAAEAAAKREAQTAKSSTRDVAALRKRGLDLLNAVRGLSRLVLRATASITLLADSLQGVDLAAPRASAAGGAEGASTSQGAPGSSSGGDGRAASVARMLGMDPSEVLELLGAAEGRTRMGGAGGASSSGSGMQFTPEAAARMAAEASRAVGELLQHVEGSLGSGLASKDAAPPADPPEWRPELLLTLVDGMEKEQALAEGRASGAIRRLREVGA